MTDPRKASKPSWVMDIVALLFFLTLVGTLISWLIPEAH